MLHGIGHCIRWTVSGDNTKRKHVAQETFAEIHTMAAEFAGWGTGYHAIAQEFTTWSRGIKTTVIDDETKTITFLNPAGLDYSRVYDEQLLYAKRMADVYEGYPHDEIENEFSEWIKEIDFSKPPIANHIKWGRGRTSRSYPLLYQKMKEVIFPELDDQTDFTGYNLEQLRQFYALMFLNFYFIRWVEDVLDARASEDALSLGSNPLYLSEAEFEKLISMITGLHAHTSRSIITDLTFNPSNFHTSISIQPFIQSSSGMYYILPNLFAQLEPSRMILGALNKGGKKKIYDSLINKIEKANLGLIHTAVSKIGGCECYIEKPIKINGKRIQPDIILIDAEAETLLVADYKHFVGPITASEVDYRMKGLKEAICQVERYIALLKVCPKIGATNIRGFAVTGLIVTHKLLPVPVPKENTIPITDLETFIERVMLVVSGQDGISTLIHRFLADHTEHAKSVFEDYESEITVGEWTVRRYQHKILSRGVN